MDETCHGVPIWPEEDKNSSRRMQFCRGEPRYYFWVKSCDQQPLLSLRRDLLLLHQNGDLTMLKAKTVPPHGTYITALEQGKMIRGRVLSRDARCSEDNENGRSNHQAILVLDVDEGTSSWVPLNQVRQLPQNMMKLPAQAVRCDLGLDCEEQFKWPLQLNDMIGRCLTNSTLFVENISNRPGSIPTISAKIMILNNSQGTTVDFREWLLGEFSHHLKICGLDIYKPFPVGMGSAQDTLLPSNDVTVTNPLIANPYSSGLPFNAPADMLQILQQHMLSLNLQPPVPYFLAGGGFNKPLSAPPGLCVPVDDLSVSLRSSLGSPNQTMSVSSNQDYLANLSLPQSFHSSVDSLYPGSVHSGSHGTSSSVAVDLSVHSDSSEYHEEETKRPTALSALEKDSHSTQQQREKSEVSSSSHSPKAESPKEISKAVVSSPTTSLHTWKGNQVALQEVDYKWSPGEVIVALVAHCYDPQAFEVNVVDENCTLLQEIRDEMSQFYKNMRIHLDSKSRAKSECGEYCAFYDKNEQCWSRAEVINWHLEDTKAPLQVWSVDIGGTAMVELEYIQPLSSTLACSAPRLATMCTMQNVRPIGKEVSWSEAHVKRFQELMPVETVVYLRVDGRKGLGGWPVSVFRDKDCSLESINEMLVLHKCASYVGSSENSRKQQNEHCNDYDDNPMEEAFKIGGNNYELDDEDACVAVSGRRPKDEEGICWAFQRAGGFCYKKHCTLRHVLLDPDGITMDKEEVLAEPYEELHLPEPGEFIQLSVSRILKVHHFIAQMKIGKGNTSFRAQETLASILQHLNSTATKRSLKVFTVFPAVGELVLAKNKTGKYFRGRVLEIDVEDDDRYLVFNVDDGHVEWIKLADLRIMDPAYLHHPCQAIECWLYNVVPANEDTDWIRTCNTIFADIVGGKTLTAKVIRVSPMGLEIILYDTDGRNISDYLAADGVLKECSIQHLPSVESPCLPGYAADAR